MNQRLGDSFFPFFVPVPSLLRLAVLWVRHKPGMGGSKWACQFSAFRGCDETRMGLEQCLSVRECLHGRGVTCYCRSKPAEEEIAADLQWPATGVKREITGSWGDSEVRVPLLPAEDDVDEGAISERWTLVKKYVFLQSFGILDLKSFFFFALHEFINISVQHKIIKYVYLKM